MATQSTLSSPTNTNAVSPTPQIPTTPLAIGSLPTMQQLPTLRDPEWLKLEVCREYQRGACKRTAEECKYAHPSKNIQVMPDGKVIACFDALKGRCSRESCKYLHPPPHLKQQLEINGRNNLIQQRAMLQMMPQTILQSPTGQVQVSTTQPMISSLQQAAPPSQMYSQAQVTSSPAYTVLPTGEIAFNSPLFYYPNNVASTTAHPMALTSTGQVTAIASPLNNVSRADRLEVCRDYQRGNCTRGEHECRYAHPMDRGMIDLADNTVTVCMDCIKGRCVRDKCKYFHPPAHLQAKIRATQHQAAAYLPAIAAGSPALTSTQPAVVANNTMSTALGQPPQKRHAVEGKVVTGTGTIGAPLAQSPNGTAALYSYGLPVQQQAATAAHAYYQVPFLSMYNGASPSAMQSAPSPLASLPATNGQANVSNATALALLNGQSQPTSSLTVCRDYQSGKCSRPYCRFVHVTEDFVEVKDDKVTVCKDALLGKCTRAFCKFYHYPQSEPNTQYAPTNYQQQSYQRLAPPEAMSPPAPINSPGMLSTMPPAAAIYSQPAHLLTTDLQVGF